MRVTVVCMCAVCGLCGTRFPLTGRHAVALEIRVRRRRNGGHGLLASKPNLPSTFFSSYQPRSDPPILANHSQEPTITATTSRHALHRSGYDCCAFCHHDRQWRVWHSIHTSRALVLCSRSDVFAREQYAPLVERAHAERGWPIS